MIGDAEEQVAKIRENLKVAQSRQKSYADTRRRELSFEVGDYVYLKVSPPMRNSKVPSSWKIIIEVYWTIPNYGKNWRSGISSGVT